MADREQSRISTSLFSDDRNEAASRNAMEREQEARRQAAAHRGRRAAAVSAFLLVPLLISAGMLWYGQHRRTVQAAAQAATESAARPAPAWEPAASGNPEARLHIILNAADSSEVPYALGILLDWAVATKPSRIRLEMWYLGHKPDVTADELRHSRRTLTFTVDGKVRHKSGDFSEFTAQSLADLINLIFTETYPQEQYPLHMAPEEPPQRRPRPSSLPLPLSPHDN